MKVSIAELHKVEPPSVVVAINWRTKLFRVVDQYNDGMTYRVEQFVPMGRTGGVSNGTWKMLSSHTSTKGPWHGPSMVVAFQAIANAEGKYVKHLQQEMMEAHKQGAQILRG